jgi:PAS domain S-box-containing protein
MTTTTDVPVVLTDRGCDDDVAALLDALDIAGDAVIGIGTDGTINAWNAGAQTLLGWTAPEVTGRPLVDAVIAPSFRQEADHSLRQLCRLDTAVRTGPLEVPVLHRDGHQLWVESRVGRLQTSGCCMFFVFMRDIGQRRDAVEALARSEALHRLITQNSSDLITRHAPDGRILYVSPSVRQLLGRTPEELLGCDPAQLLHADDAASFDVGEDCLEPIQHRRELTFRLRHHDGRWVWFEALLSVVHDAQGGISEIQVCSRDITDRKVREAEMHQDSKLESLGRLSAGLAHEINSPIQFVGDNARFLAEAYQDLIRIVLFYRGLLDSTDPIGWDERRARMRVAEEGIEFEYLQAEIPTAVEQTLHGIDRVATIVRAMKTFSHPGHKEQVPADLNEALEATVTVTRHQVNSVADLQLELAELPPVKCNIADLNQVFLNLIVNAADAIAETGTPGLIGVTTAHDGDHVVITISDTGGGIPDDVRTRMFDPFFTTKEVGKGSGQGLPLVRAVIQEGHRGSLTVQSTVGVGTTFTIRLPIDGQPCPAPDPQDPPDPLPERSCATPRYARPRRRGSDSTICSGCCSPSRNTPPTVCGTARRRRSASSARPGAGWSTSATRTSTARPHRSPARTWLTVTSGCSWPPGCVPATAGACAAAANTSGAACAQHDLNGAACLRWASAADRSTRGRWLPGRRPRVRHAAGPHRR